MSSQPPSKDRRTPPPFAGPSEKRKYRPEDFGFAPEPQVSKVKTEPLARKVYRFMFVIGMIIGALLSLLVPVDPWTVEWNDQTYNVPLAVGPLPVAARVVVYVIIVFANAYLWSYLAVKVCNRYFPPPDTGQKAPVWEPTNDAPVYNLDDS
jgi:hypothetical protein